MYIPNFKFLAQFREELCEEKTQKKKRKPVQPSKNTLAKKRGETGVLDYPFKVEEIEKFLYFC